MMVLGVSAFSYERGTPVVQTHSGADKQKFAAISRTAFLHVHGYLVYRKTQLEETHQIQPLCFLD